MKRLVLALAATTALVIGAGSAHAQADPIIEVTGEVEPGANVTVSISGAEADAAIEATLGDQTASGVADGDGTASVQIQAPDAEGGHDGTVTINGVAYPFSVVVAAVAAAGGGDGTPQPSAVNTGDSLSSSNNSTALFAAAAGLFLLGGGAFALRRRSVES